VFAFHFYEMDFAELLSSVFFSKAKILANGEVRFMNFLGTVIDYFETD